MRILMTGHQGYIGTVMLPILKDAGHQVIGMDVGFFTGNVFGERSRTQPGLSKDMRDIVPDDLAGAGPSRTPDGDELDRAFLDRPAVQQHGAGDLRRRGP